MKINIYKPIQKNAWNDFVRNAKNTHFFFLRDYMEYHQERFDDFSLMVYSDNDKLVALLPGNRKENILYSHQGLTFGGFIVQDSMKMKTMLEIFDALELFLIERAFTSLIYKVIPYIHHIKPAEGDRYALFLHGARLVRREANATVYLDEPVKYSHGRKWSIKKAKKEELTLAQSDNFSAFWGLLQSVLDEHHHAKPVHSLEEIERLASLFQNNIKLYTASREEVLIAGALVYENPHIVNLQYVANSTLGREIGALDLLIDHLIQKQYGTKKYFNFGISNEEDGRVLNNGLMDQKERFGARVVAYDTYEWKLS